MATRPVKKKDWVKVGDRCESAGTYGTVIKVVAMRSIPYAVVRWDNGSTGRHTITTINRVKGV